jgi:hypothetical protein
MAALTVDMLKRVMAEDGPVVSLVQVPAETGVPREVEVDMTPRLRETTRLLGGSATFLGQWAALGVVILARRDAAEAGLVRVSHACGVERVAPQWRVSC